MPIAPATLVQGVPRVPLPYGLLSVVSPREGSTDRWEAGARWETDTCEPVGGIASPDCDPETDTIGLPKTLDQGDGEVGEASPFYVYGHHTCSPIGNSFEDAQAKATRHLETREEARVEQALWTGDLGNVPNFSGANGYAAPTPVGGAGPIDSVLAVALLEQHIAETYGGLGVMHMSRAVALWLVKRGALDRSGGRITTELGTPVIAGTGYADDRIVVTAGMFAYRSEVFDSSSTRGDLLDRETNDLYAIAERGWLVGFDPCGLAAANVDITAEGSSSGGGEVDPETEARITALETEMPTKADQTAVDTALAGKADTTHTHAAADITSGTLAVARVPNLATSKITGLDTALSDLSTEVDGKVDGVTSGSQEITVDNTDPNNPVIGYQPI